MPFTNPGEKTQKTISNIVLCFFAAFNICFFTPTDLFLTNANDIAFPIKPLLLFMAAVTIIVFAAAFLICQFTRGKANAVFRSIIFGVSMAFYIQGNFLAIGMGELNGTQYTTPVYKIVVNTVIWIAVLAAPFFILLKKPKIFDNVLSYIPAAVILIQIIALGFSAYNSIPKWTSFSLSEIFDGQSKSYYTYDDLDLYSKNKNLIVILADEYDSFMFDSALENAPDSVSEFDGFTYYTNTVGKYQLTSMSISYMLTGELTIDGHFQNKKLIQDLSRQYKMNFYCSNLAPPVEFVSNHCDNIKYVNVTFADTYEYSASLFRLVFFRCMPEIVKPAFWTDGINFGRNSDSLVTQKEDIYGYENLNFYNNMPHELKLSDDENIFKFIYIYGLHSPRKASKDLEKTDDDVSPEETAEAVNKIVNEYLKTLKDNGVYDNSEILFLADHGLTGHENKKYPLLMYKPAHQTETGIKISDAPISYDDIYPTLILLSGGEPEARTIFDIAEDEERVRHFEDTNEDITGNIKQLEVRVLEARE